MCSWLKQIPGAGDAEGADSHWHDAPGGALFLWLFPSTSPVVVLPQSQCTETEIRAEINLYSVGVPQIVSHNKEKANAENLYQEGKNKI